LKSFRANRLLHTVIVAMTLVGWFVLSNHCALAGLAKRTAIEKEHACCHNGTSAPTKEPTDGGQGMQCCKSVHALAPDTAKPADSPVSLVVGAVFAWVDTFNLDGVASRVSTVDTGPPPRAASFSELVLHRSLRSHAPPFLA
jgi:hypothetical protein